LCFFTSRGSSEETDDINGNKKAAKRRLLYVFGIDVLNMDQIEFITRVHYKAFNQPFDSVFGEHEIDYILFIKGDNKNEIKSYKYLNEKELVQILKNEEYKFTPWFKLICDKFIFKWWPHIDNLENIKDDKNI
jgi:isopentenyl-diphosphate delta-isomerase